MRRLGYLALIVPCLCSYAAAEAPAIFAQRDVRLAQATKPIAAPKPLTPNEPAPRMTLGELTPTPSMWLYEQERRRYEDPRSSVRVNAEQRGVQRRQRIAAMQWFGYSNSRPTVSVTPFTGTAAPQWGSNSADPFIWTGVRRPTVVYVPDNGTYVR